ncbi:MAG: PEP-CTERM sorting domain-containing protein [Bryobacteraceae bacterium]
MLVRLLILSTALVTCAAAAPTQYTIDFSLDGGSTKPQFGVFTYDPAVSQFTNFYVVWNGSLFDLTGAANAPTMGGACAGMPSSPAAGLALMEQSLCAGLNYGWLGLPGTTNSFFFNASTSGSPGQNAAIAGVASGADGSPLASLSGGQWTSTINPTPFTHLIQFTGGPTAPFGMFSYDPSSSVFSKFVVFWSGSLFDLTSSANAPSVGGACPGLDSSPATGFALMEKSLCDGLDYNWLGFPGNPSLFFFSASTPSQNAAGISGAGPATNNPLALSSGGEWTITSLSASISDVPEPSTLILFSTAGVMYILNRWRRASRPVAVQSGKTEQD